jgi:hypothetical protein
LSKILKNYYTTNLLKPNPSYQKKCEKFNALVRKKQALYIQLRNAVLSRILREIQYSYRTWRRKRERWGGGGASKTIGTIRKFSPLPRVQ